MPDRAKWLTVYVDSREKYPVTFPKWVVMPRNSMSTESELVEIRTRVTRMEAGDYGLRGHLDKCLIERKASVQELANNLCSDDWFRQRTAFRRMSKACQRPILLLDGSIGDFTRYVQSPKFTDRYKLPDPSIVMNRLVACCIQYRMDLWWVGGGRAATTRTALGALIIQVLAQYAFLTTETEMKLLQQAADAVKAAKINQNKEAISLAPR